MKKNSIKKKIFIIIIIIASIVLWNFKLKAEFSSKEEYLKISKWDNFYKGDNIHFYYLNSTNENLVKIKSKYELNKLVNNKVDQVENAIAIMNWINGKVKVKSTAMVTKKDALEIMETAFQGNEISYIDYVTIYEECLSSVGISTRKGTLRAIDEEIKDNSYFNVCEIWSNKYNKWVMIDGINSCYMKGNQVPLSAVEIVDKGIKKVEIVGVEHREKFLKNMSACYGSYSILIDNNKYGELKSNSHITYLKENQLPKLETKEGFVQPTIFVDNPKLFQISPKGKYVNKNSDKIPTLIFAKKDLKNDTNEVLNFTVGAFKNSYTLSSYFISVNGSDFIKANTFYDLQINEGVNSIKLSEDGKNAIREVIIER